LGDFVVGATKSAACHSFRKPCGWPPEPYLSPRTSQSECRDELEQIEAKSSAIRGTIQNVGRRCTLADESIPPGERRGSHRPTGPRHWRPGPSRESAHLVVVNVASTDAAGRCFGPTPDWAELDRLLAQCSQAHSVCRRRCPTRSVRTTFVQHTGRCPPIGGMARSIYRRLGRGHVHTTRCARLFGLGPGVAMSWPSRRTGLAAAFRRGDRLAGQCGSSSGRRAGWCPANSPGRSALVGRGLLD